MATTAIKIMRRSIHTFLKHYNHFTTCSLLSLPFSASLLLSSIIPLNSSFHSSLHSIFTATGFPSQSQFFSQKLSQTITSLFLILPFTLSFLPISKSSIIQSLNTSSKPNSFAGIFNSVLRTQLWNSFVVVSANATSFWLLFIAFNCLENLNISSSPTLLLFFSAFAGIAYSVVVANALMICNLALVVSGMEMNGGYISILKACVMVRGRTPIALSLALPINISLACIESLFRFRLRNAYSDSGVTPSMVLEGLLIAYMYSIILTLDTINGCIFFKSCKIASENVLDQDLEDGDGDGDDDDECGFEYVKCLAKELP